MSTVFLDIIRGDFSQAVNDFNSWWGNLPPWAKNFINKLKGSEGAILQGLVAVAAADVQTGGLTTASFVNAGKDVYAKLVAQNISTFSLQYVIAAINQAVDDAKSATATPAS